MLRDEAWTEDELNSLQAISPRQLSWTVAIGLVGAFCIHVPGCHPLEDARRAVQREINGLVSMPSRVGEWQ